MYINAHTRIGIIKFTTWLKCKFQLWPHHHIICTYIQHISKCKSKENNICAYLIRIPKKHTMSVFRKTGPYLWISLAHTRKVSENIVLSRWNILNMISIYRWNYLLTDDIKPKKTCKTLQRKILNIKTHTAGWQFMERCRSTVCNNIRRDTEKHIVEKLSAGKTNIHHGKHIT